jgi:hypothetical protein
MQLYLCQDGHTINYHTVMGYYDGTSNAHADYPVAWGAWNPNSNFILFNYFSGQTLTMSITSTGYTATAHGYLMKIQN